MTARAATGFGLATSHGHRALGRLGAQVLEDVAVFGEVQLALEASGLCGGVGARRAELGRVAVDGAERLERASGGGASVVLVLGVVVGLVYAVVPLLG